MSERRSGTRPDQDPATRAGAGGRVVTETDAPADLGVFDAHHPPSQDRIDDCVHCGFCLPTCPTYALWGEEMDSPRGRIHLMHLGLRGEADLDEIVPHFDACLGCMACVTSCPSGVRYDELIEATRAQVERHYDRQAPERWFRRLVFALFPHPLRLRVAVLLGWLYQRLGLRALAHRTGLAGRLPPRLRALEALMPPMAPRTALARVPERTPAQGATRRRVGLVTGCVQRVFFGDVNAATVRVLAAEGCEVVAPVTQSCCGALMVHAGDEDAALARARALIDAFEPTGVDTVVINAAGCGSTLKDYGRLLADDPAYADRAAAFSARVRDVTELLTELDPVAPRRHVPARVAYHDACHLAHAQGVRSQPRSLLVGIPGVELAEIADPEICCGSAGIYNLVQPQPAEELGRRKAASILATGADAVVTTNPGCILQLRRFLDGELPLLHPVQVLDASIRGLDPLSLERKPA